MSGATALDKLKELKGEFGADGGAPAAPAAPSARPEPAALAPAPAPVPTPPEDDDASGAYRKRVEVRNASTVLERLKKSYTKKVTPAEPAAPPADPAKAGQTATRADGTRPDGSLEVYVAPWRQKIAGAAGDVVQGIMETLTLNPNRNAILHGIHSALSEVDDTLGRVTGVDFNELVPEDLKFRPEGPESTTGQMVGSITQFMAGFVPILKGVKALGLAGKLGSAGVAVEVMVAGALAEPAVMDEQEQRLSDLIESFPALQNPLTEYLAADPDDTMAEGKLKQAIEGLVTGGAAEGLTASFKLFKHLKAARAAAPEAQAAEAVAKAQRALRETETEALGLTPRDEIVLGGGPDKPTFEITEAVDRRADALVEERRARRTDWMNEIDADFIQEPLGSFEDVTFARGAPSIEAAQAAAERAFSEFPAIRVKDLNAASGGLAGYIIDSKGRIFEIGEDHGKFFKKMADALGVGDKTPPEAGGAGVSSVYLADRASLTIFRLTMNSAGEMSGGLDVFGSPTAAQVQTINRVRARIGKGNWSLSHFADESTPAATESSRDAAAKEAAESAGMKETGEEAADDIPGRFAIGDRIANVNLGRIGSADDVRDVIRQAGQMMLEAGEIAPTVRQGTDEALALANKVLVDPEHVRRVLSGESGAGRAFTREEVLATGMLLDQSGKSMTGLARKIAQSGGSESEKLALRRAVAFHGDLMKVVSGQAREAGRALQAFQTTVKGNKATAQAVRDLMSADSGTDDMARMLATLTEPEQIAAAVKAIEKPGFIRYVQEYWINSILSGPFTHMVNITGNTMNLFTIPIERAVGSRLPGASGELVKGEAAASLYGMMQGFKDGLRLAARSFKAGQPMGPDQAAKIETLQHNTITAKNLALDENGIPGKAVDLAGTVLRLPGRFLMAEDEFFKAVSRRMELNALAYRTAAHEGLKGPDAARRVADLMANPTDDMMAQSVKMAQYVTFTKPLGRAGATATAAINQIPVVRFVVPFIRTPTNIMKFAGERSPLALGSRAVRDEIAAGGARRDLALAKIGLGSMAMATAADYAQQGYITGGGPGDWRERQVLERQGWQPYSIWVPGLDRWVAYNRLDPLGLTIGVASDMSKVLDTVDQVGGLVATPETRAAAMKALVDGGYDEQTARAAVDRLAEADGDGVEEAMAMLLTSIGENVVNKSYMSGLSDLIEIFSAPSPEYGASKAERYLTRLATGFLPFSSLQRQTARMIDPTMRQATGLMDAIKQMTPGLSDSLPAMPDLWGQPREHANRFSPFANREPKDSPVDAEMQRLGMAIAMPQREVSGVKLEPAEYLRYVQLAGNELKLAGRTYQVKGDKNFVESSMGAKDLIEAVIKGTHPDKQRVELYKNSTDGPDGGKALMIRTFVTTFRDAARKRMLQDAPLIRGALDARKWYEQRKRTGQ